MLHKLHTCHPGWDVNFLLVHSEPVVLKAVPGIVCITDGREGLHLLPSYVFMEGGCLYPFHCNFFCP